MKSSQGYFAQLYKEEREWRLNLDGLFFPSLYEHAKADLESAFSEEEILEDLRACNKDNAPGLDKFNMGFLLEFWDVIKVDMKAVFEKFHDSGRFVKSLNSTFIVLIPKVGGAANIKEFRPVSLIRSVYKLIAKVLARRMARVLDTVVGECEHACRRQTYYGCSFNCK